MLQVVLGGDFTLAELAGALQVAAAVFQLRLALGHLGFAVLDGRTVFDVVYAVEDLPLGDGVAVAEGDFLQFAGYLGDDVDKFLGQDLAHIVAGGEVFAFHDCVDWHGGGQGGSAAGHLGGQAAGQEQRHAECTRK